MSAILLELLKVAWFFLPAGCANMLTGFVKRWPILNYPIDFGKSWRGQRIFGSHKTWRGIVFGVLGAVGMVFIQKSFYPGMMHIAIIDYSQISVWKLGIIFGLGAALGDLVRSFFKRRVGIEPGGRWFPFDQIDWIVGAVIAISLYRPIPWTYAAVAIVLAAVIHPGINYVCYLAGLQKNKF